MGFTVNTGEMRSSGTFLKNIPISNDSGGQSDNFTTVLTCRGRLRQNSGKKSLEQGEIVQDKTFEWVCRFQAAIVIGADSAWNIGGQQYRISNWELVNQIPEWYRFTLTLWQ